MVLKLIMLIMLWFLKTLFMQIIYEKIFNLLFILPLLLDLDLKLIQIKNFTQCVFNSRSLPSLIILHKEWYIWLKIYNKFIKIVPLKISNLFIPLGLAH